MRTDSKAFLYHASDQTTRRFLFHSPPEHTIFYYKINNSVKCSRISGLHQLVFNETSTCSNSFPSNTVGPAVVQTLRKKKSYLTIQHSYHLLPFLPCIKVEDLGRGKSDQLKLFLVINPEAYFLPVFLIHCHIFLP